MAIKITKRGHTVKGALAVYLTPRLAADKALKPGELHKLIADLKPAAAKEQIPILVDGVKKLVEGRLIKDLDVEDLPDLLEALAEQQECDEDEEDDLDDKKPIGDEDDDLMTDDPGVKLMELLGKCNLPADTLEQVNQLVTELGKGGEPKPMKDGCPPKKGEGAPMAEVPVTKPAMDAAIAASKEAVKKSTREELGALFSASEAVAPVVGKIDTLAFDSAEAIYKYALDHLQVKCDGVHPSAYKTLLDMATKASSEKAITVDSAAVSGFEDFAKQYPTIPAHA